MRRRTANIIRGLAALALLVGLLVGVPWALVTQVGWPLPTALPTWEQFSRALTRGELDDWTIIKALAVLVWLAWAQVAANVMAEAVAVARRRPTRPVPAVGPLRSLATNLVAAVAVLVSTLGRPSVAPDEGVPALEVALTTASVDDVLTAQSPPTGGWSPGGHLAQSGAAEGEVELGARPRWTVQHRDTLWDIAESALGDGLRWREIHRLNAGRLQPDGGTLGEDGLIRAGWVLVLPEDASVGGGTAAQAQPEPGLDAREEAIVVEQGDTLWDLSDDHLGDPLRWPELYEENRGTAQPDGHQLDDPNLIQPGWILDLPEEEGPSEGSDPGDPGTEAFDTPAVSASRPPPPPPPPPPPSDGLRPEVAPSDGTVAEERRGRPEVVGEDEVSVDHAEEDTVADRVPAVAGAALVAAGAIATLDRIRRTRRRRRRPGDRIALPAGADAETELRIRGLADVADVERIDAALGSMAAARRGEGLDVPPIVMVSATAQDVALHLARPDQDSPDGWNIEDGGLTWVFTGDAERDLTDSVTGVETPSLMLVTVGTAADGARRVMLNLGHVGRLSLHAPVEVRRRLVLSMAMELATAQRPSAMEVVVHGAGGGLSSLERIRHLGSEAEVSRIIQQASEDDTDPGAVATVVLSMDRLDLSDTTVAGANFAVVSVEDGGADWSLREDGGLLQLAPAGLTLQPLELTPDELDVIGELVLQAKKAPPCPPLADAAAPPDADDETPTQPSLIDLDADIDDVDAKPIEVRILGPVEVEGAVDLTSAKAEELIVYLATHRKGATIDQLQEALWPEEEPSPGRLHTTAWRARQSLGDGPDGEALLPKVDKGRYWMSPEVGLDHDRFRAHVARYRLTPASAMAELHAALELVRGEPYTGTSTEYGWAGFEAHSIAQEVGDAAHWLAQLYLDAEQPAEARWAAEQGLRADPYLEALYRDLMEAAAAESNLTEVEVIMKRLRRLVADDADDNDADDRLDPETVRCYETLTSPVGGRGPGGGH